jgi:signal transduction histidine kinase
MSCEPSASRDRSKAGEPASSVQLAHSLERLQADVASLRAERSLLLQALEYHERDRQLLAFEIHDGIIQDMTAALMFLEAAGQQAASESSESVEKLNRGISVLRNAVVEARRLIQGLIPVQLDERGLAASLEKLVEKFTSERGLEIDYQADVQLHHLVPAVELIVLRIVQEALSNVWKHSGQNRAKLRFSQRGDRLEVTVADQGAGFDAALVKPGRYGLAGIRERAKLIGGLATIDSHPGGGTRVTLRLQLRDTMLPQAESR